MVCQINKLVVLCHVDMFLAAGQVVFFFFFLSHFILCLLSIVILDDRVYLCSCRSTSNGNLINYTSWHTNCKLYNAMFIW